MTLYCTLDDAKTDDKATGTGGDNYLLRAIRTVSRRVDREFAATRPVFAPTIEARKIRIDSTRVNSWENTLRVDGNLLALTTTVLGTTTLTDAVGYPDAAMPPFPYIRRTTQGVNWYSDCGSCDGSPLFVTLTGIWGFHSDYANAWQKVDDLGADITSSATSLTVADIDGADVYGFTPRISAGNLLKIGTEFLEVTATVVGTNTATVRRGVNGSTAAAHTSGDDVYVWQVEDPIRAVVARQSAMLYSRRGAFTSVEITALGSEIRFPADLLTELRAVLQDYAYVA